VHVYHDGTDPIIPWFYGRHGIPCEPMPGFEDRHDTSPSADDVRLHEANGGFVASGPAGSTEAYTNEADALTAYELGMFATEGQLLDGEAEMEEQPLEETSTDTESVDVQPEPEVVAEVTLAEAEAHGEILAIEEKLDQDPGVEE
jgi:hypothetical protein